MPVNFLAATERTVGYPQNHFRIAEIAATLIAAVPVAVEIDFPAFNGQGQPFDNRFGDFLARRTENPGESRTRNAHNHRSLKVSMQIIIAKAYGFVLIV